MPQVQVIAPLHVSEPAKLRVCAYARVSSDSAISSIPLRRRCDITQT